PSSFNSNDSLETQPVDIMGVPTPTEDPGPPENMAPETARRLYQGGTRTLQMAPAPEQAQAKKKPERLEPAPKTPPRRRPPTSPEGSPAPKTPERPRAAPHSPEAPAPKSPERLPAPTVGPAAPKGPFPNGVERPPAPNPERPAPNAVECPLAPKTPERLPVSAGDAAGSGEKFTPDAEVKLISPTTRAEQLVLRTSAKKNKKGKKRVSRSKGNKKRSRAVTSPSGRRRSLLKKRRRSASFADPEATAGPDEAEKLGHEHEAGEDGDWAPEPDAKVLASKPSRKGKAKATKAASGDDEAVSGKPKRDTNARLLMISFAREFYEHRHDSIAQFKLRICEVLPEATRYKVALLNKYWTRYSCGVTIKETRKDITSFHIPHSKVLPNLRLCVTFRCALLLVQFLDMLFLCEDCPNTGLSYRELGVEHLVQTSVVKEFIEALKQDGQEAVEEMAEQWEM
ncbi:unnamed protein product, partial [Symbiodinium sp. CCMP2456]